MSSSVLVCYTIQGDEDDPETGVESSFRVERPRSPRTLTLFRLKELFPFVGTFHFRLKIADDSRLSDFCWVDLTTDGDDILELANNLGGLEGSNGSEPRMHLKVLPIDFGNARAEAGADVGAETFAHTETPVPPAHAETLSEDDLAGGVAGLDLGDGRVHVNEASTSHGSPRAPEQRSRAVDHDEDDFGSSPDRDDVSSGIGGAGGGGGDGVGGSDSGGGRRPERARGEGHRRRDDDDYGGYDASEEGSDRKGSAESTFHSGLSQASQGVKDLQKKSAQVAKTMGFGAKKLWQTINKGVGGAQVPSEAALENLQELAGMLGTLFSGSKPEHLQELGRIWSCLFPDDEFEGVESPRWREAGFQDENVAGDFRGTGVLALKALAYFCQNHGQKAQALFRAQSGRSSSTYPWAVVANNLTLMLAEVLELRADRFADSRKGYWGIFDKRAAFFEVFCMAFALLDHSWTTRRATRDQFGQIIGYTREVITEVLESNPPDLQAFMGAAEEMGMLRL